MPVADLVIRMPTTVVPLPAVLAKFGPKPFARTLRQRVGVAAWVLCAALGVLAVVALVNQSTGGALWT